MSVSVCLLSDIIKVPSPLTLSNITVYPVFAKAKKKAGFIPLLKQPQFQVIFPDKIELPDDFQCLRHRFFRCFVG
jgi:hypothetical protein